MPTLFHKVFGFPFSLFKSLTDTGGSALRPDRGLSVSDVAQQYGDCQLNITIHDQGVLTSHDGPLNTIIHWLSVNLVCVFGQIPKP